MPTAQEVGSWVTLADKLSVIALLAGMLAVALIGLYRIWYVPGWLYRQTHEELVQSRAMVLKLLGLNERLADLARSHGPRQD
jgi:hypothetical protein